MLDLKNPDDKEKILAALTEAGKLGMTPVQSALHADVSLAALLSALITDEEVRGAYETGTLAGSQNALDLIKEIAEDPDANGRGSAAIYLHKHYENLGQQTSAVIEKLLPGTSGNSGSGNPQIADVITPDMIQLQQKRRDERKVITGKFGPAANSAANQDDLHRKIDDSPRDPSGSD